MLDSIRNRPSDELLEQGAPIIEWERATKQAMRSTHNRHRTGCCISLKYRGYYHFSCGCSHKHNGSLAVNSIHAESHALRYYRGEGGTAVVVTLTKANNFAGCSRPCASCAASLQKRFIGVVYAELTNDGGWAIREVPFDMLTHGYLKPTKYSDEC